MSCHKWLTSNSEENMVPNWYCTECSLPVVNIFKGMYVHSCIWVIISTDISIISFYMNVYLYIERHIYFDGVQSIYIKYIYIYIERVIKTERYTLIII